MTLAVVTNEQSGESDSPEPPPPSGEPTLTGQAAEDYRLQIDQSRDFLAGAPQTRDSQTRDGPAHHDKTSTRPLASHLVRRSGSDRYVGGVLGGVADRFGLDSSILRIGIVAATLYLRLRFGPYALPIGLYVLMWLTLPTPPTTETSDRALLMQLQRRAAAQEVAVAIVSFFAALLALESGDDLGALLLGAIAVVLLASRRSPTKHQTPSSPNSFTHDNPTSADQGTEPGTHFNTDPDGRDARRTSRQDGLAALQARIPFRRRAERSTTPGKESNSVGNAPLIQRATRKLREPALWPLTAGLLALGAIGAAAADYVLDPGLDPGVIVNGAILIIASVLVLSWWRGRARITIVWLLLLAPLWVGFSWSDTERLPGAGSTSFSPTLRPANGVLAYELGYGKIDLNLRHLKLEPGSTTTVEINMTAGSVAVLLPTEVHLTVDAEVGLGTLNINLLDDWVSRSIVADTYTHSFQSGHRNCNLHWFGRDELADLSYFVTHNSTRFPVGTEPINDFQDFNSARPLAIFDWEQEIARWQQAPSTEVVEFFNQHGIVILEHDQDDSYEEWLISVDTQGRPCTIAPDTEPPTPPTIILRSSIGVGTIEVDHA